MNIHVSGRHFSITESLHSFIDSKFARIGRHFDQVTDLHVVLTSEKLTKRAEATVHVNGKDIHVESRDADMYAAIDTLTDKLDRSILRHKDAVRAHPHDALKHRAQVE